MANDPYHVMQMVQFGIEASRIWNVAFASIVSLALASGSLCAQVAGPDTTSRGSRVVKVRALSSFDRDNTPLITADGRFLFFNSTRWEHRPWSRYDTTLARFDDDIYYSRLLADTSGEERWSPPVNIGRPINSSEDDGVAAIDPDGFTMYFVSLKRGWDRDGGPFYKANAYGGQWSAVVGLGGNLTRFFRRSIGDRIRIYGAAISADGKDFYFATTANSRNGNQQIWVSHKLGSEWGYPENLGPTINAEGGSYAPFIASDGRTLFFASRRAGGLGGDDIYVSVFRNNQWETPVNVGAPINSPSDEAFLSIPASGDRLFFSSARDGSDDIYTAPLVEEFRPLNVLRLTSNTLDMMTGEPVEVPVGIEGIKTMNAIPDVRSQTFVERPIDRTTRAGLHVDNERFVADVVREESSAIGERAAAETIQELSYKQIFDRYAIALPASVLNSVTRGRSSSDVPQAADRGRSRRDEPAAGPVETASVASTDMERTNDAALGVVEIDGVAQLPPDASLATLEGHLLQRDSVSIGAIFENDQSAVEPGRAPVLDRLAEMLKARPTMRIVVVGNADSRGGTEYNRRLSIRRAAAIRRYLIAGGASPKNIVVRGNGAARPVATNDSEEGRRLNRRVDVTVRVR